MDTLISVLQGQPGRLDIAALELARIEFPMLDLDGPLDELDRLAAGVEGGSAAEWLAHFRSLGFRGNEVNYYDPLNSCLNAVLERRTGIPITLSVVYAEVARRRGRPLDYIGLPGHFMLGDGKRLIDAFHGRIYTREQAARLVRELSGVDVATTPEAFLPIAPQAVIARMLNNLRGVYLARSHYGKAAQVLELLRLATGGGARKTVEAELTAIRRRQATLN